MKPEENRMREHKERAERKIMFERTLKLFESNEKC
jgi:hypothetical protein